MKRRALAAVALSFVGFPSAPRAQGLSRDIDMSRYTAGNLPSDFVTTGQGSVGSWAVVNDPTASQGKAIVQENAEPTAYRFPLAVFTPIAAQNVAVSVRFKAVAGDIDRAAGIALRLSGPAEYYVVRASIVEQNVILYRMANGIMQQLAGAPAELHSDRWHMLAVRAVGDRFSISFDDKELFTAQDDGIRKTGLVALWTEFDSITRFDGLKLQSMP